MPVKSMVEQLICQGCMTLPADSLCSQATRATVLSVSWQSRIQANRVLAPLPGVRCQFFDKKMKVVEVQSELKRSGKKHRDR